MLLNGICSGLSKVLLPCAAFPKRPKKAPDSADLARRLNDPAILWHVSSLKLLYALNKDFLRVDLAEGQGDSGVTQLNSWVWRGVPFCFRFFPPPFLFPGISRKTNRRLALLFFLLHPFFLLGGFKGNQKETHRFGSQLNSFTLQMQRKNDVGGSGGFCKTSPSWCTPPCRSRRPSELERRKLN